MDDDLLTHKQVTEMRRNALALLVQTYGGAEVARRVKRQAQQINDMARTKSFGEKVALEFEREWRKSGGDPIDLIAPRPRKDVSDKPAGWDRLDDLGRAKVEAYISGLLAQASPHATGRIKAD
ncbi:hypothetical protein AAGS40_23410 [Paraburkholderia sp. PREW-6R]|uniref:hypothetical protein n=1 Tax=Paraburkholderia sp. PREW-6R TaxID=3141544 RepID=UPI0031F52389